jgi:hypothetical protein
MNLNLNLIILHLDLQTSNGGCLVDDERLISRPLSNTNIDSGLRDILLEYLEIRPEWVKFHLVDVLYTKSEIVLVYSCLIPIVIQSKKGQWMPLGAINDSKAKELVFKASQKVCAGY